MGYDGKPCWDVAVPTDMKTLNWMGSRNGSLGDVTYAKEETMCTEAQGTLQGTWPEDLLSGRCGRLFCPIERYTGLRNPFVYELVDQQMLAVLSYFMRNPSNWVPHAVHEEMVFHLGIEKIGSEENQVIFHYYCGIMKVNDPRPNQPEVREKKTMAPEKFALHKKADHPVGSSHRPGHMEIAVEQDKLWILPKHLQWYFPVMNEYAARGHWPTSFLKVVSDFYDGVTETARGKPRQAFTPMSQHYSNRGSRNKPEAPVDESQSQAKMMRAELEQVNQLTSMMQSQMQVQMEAARNMIQSAQEIQVERARQTEARMVLEEQTRDLAEHHEAVQESLNFVDQIQQLRGDELARALGANVPENAPTVTQMFTGSAYSLQEVPSETEPCAAPMECPIGAVEVGMIGGNRPMVKAPPATMRPAPVAPAPLSAAPQPAVVPQPVQNPMNEEAPTSLVVQQHDEETLSQMHQTAQQQVSVFDQVTVQPDLQGQIAGAKPWLTRVSRQQVKAIHSQEPAWEDPSAPILMPYIVNESLTEVETYLIPPMWHTLNETQKYSALVDVGPSGSRAADMTMIDNFVKIIQGEPIPARSRYLPHRIVLGSPERSEYGNIVIPRHDADQLDAVFRHRTPETRRAIEAGIDLSGQTHTVVAGDRLVNMPRLSLQNMQPNNIESTDVVDAYVAAVSPVPAQDSEDSMPFGPTGRMVDE